MCTSVMDYQIISHIDLRKHPVDGKFIIIFTKRSCDIIYMICWFVFFTHNCDVMVSTVQSRTHKVRCAGIYTDVFFISMFLMNCFYYKMSVWRKHETSKFCKDLYISHSCWN